jgi:hypothetical protein
MGPEYLALALAGAGTAATLIGQQQQASEKRGILNRQMEEQDRATKKNTQMVEDESQRYSMENRLQGLEDAEKKTYEQTQADLTGAGGASISAAADAGNVSDDFIKTKAARALEEGNRLTSIARESAKSRAPGLLNLDDSLSMARMKGEAGSLWGTTRNMSRANSMTADSVGPSGLATLGTIASAVGNGLAAGGYGQVKPGVPPNPYALNTSGGVNFGGYRG